VFYSLLLFAFLMGGAIGAYPGGTPFDPAHPGYSFWYNFWCDALRDPALGGQSNARGARLATFALWVLGVGLLPFWDLMADLVAESSRDLQGRIFGWGIRFFGLGGTFGMLGVALVPSDRFPFLHGLLITLAGPAGLSAAALAVVAGLRSRRVPAAASALGVLALVFGFANLAQYARQFWLTAPSSTLLPGIQKLASLFFFAWVASTTAATAVPRRRARRRRA
jgi:hypothetical protein